MAGQRKRKHTSLDDSQSKQTSLRTTQQTIQDFGSIKKPNAVDNASKKRKVAHKRESTPPPVVQTSTAKLDRKRKRALNTVDEEADDEDSSCNSASQYPVLKQLKQINAVTPRSKGSKTHQIPSPADTPSKDTTALFDKLKLSRATNPIPLSFNAKEQAYGTPPHTPPADHYNPEHLPAELEDLLMLQAAFLSALSLYFAHNGTSSPVNVRDLLPLITKSWKKRAVSLDDLRILLGVGYREAQFTLQDFGRAGICLTKSQPRGRAVKRTASFVDEVDLNAGFEEALQKRWSQWLVATPKENHDVCVFMDQLPPAEITKHESVQHTAPLFARGQQRLADLKASQAAANSPQAKAPQITPEQKSDAIIQSRGTSLLDRILAKQAHAASLPAGPTREQLERKSALHRIEEIERIIDLLAAGRPRCTFSMPVMIQQLQQSLRNPISKEDVERCLDLMAGEITPGFIRLVRTGTVTGVVVTKGGKVGLEQLRQRVLGAGG